MGVVAVRLGAGWALGFSSRAAWPIQHSAGEVGGVEVFEHFTRRFICDGVLSGEADGLGAATCLCGVAGPRINTTTGQPSNSTVSVTDEPASLRLDLFDDFAVGECRVEHVECSLVF
jgi:hypothetical protein